MTSGLRRTPPSGRSFRDPSPGSAAPAQQPADGAGERLSRLHDLIERASELLPAQGPINVFIHHNTLHAFEDMPFHEALTRGAALFGCQAYLSEDRYLEKLARGRISIADLAAALRADLESRADERLPALGTRLELRLAMLQHPPRLAPDAELKWFVAQTDALRRFRRDVPDAVRGRFLDATRQWILRESGGRSSGGDAVQPQARQIVADLLKQFPEPLRESWPDETWELFSLQALWRLCRDGVRTVKTLAIPAPRPRRHRDVLFDACGEDSDALVNDVLMPYCAAFLDQGVSRWSLPGRERGFWRAFVALYSQSAGPPDAWLRGLGGELVRLAQAQPLESTYDSLRLLGVAETEWDDFLTATLLALRGWAGMIRQLELRGDRVAHAVARGSLVEFVAVRLLLERLALAHVAEEAFGFTGPLHALRAELGAQAQRRPRASRDQRAFLVFQLAQVVGASPAELSRLTQADWSALLSEIEAFSNLERRRIFHLAFEHAYRTQTLDALSVGAAAPAGEGHGRALPRFQALFCIDEREESLRRHLEELAPDVETFGAAGFFGVAMYYRGVDEAHAVPLCPIAIRPRHQVEEEVISTQAHSHRRREQRRRLAGTLALQVHIGSRSFTLGALLAMFLGILACLPLIARIVWPRWTAWLRRQLGRLLRPPRTRLQLEAVPASPEAAATGLGYTVDEMSLIVERLLRDIGLSGRFARLVVVVGHGSTSLNNPHESAHDCGACGGGRGGPNARAFTEMANDPRVRERLAVTGLNIPSQTVFVGAYHNTCDDSIAFFDLDRFPESHRPVLAAARGALEEALKRNAHERCRRFESAPLTLSAEAALKHVQARAEDLAQVRPEYGHATNAVCIVGRRARTRGLFLDRRAFLASYDPTQDDADCTILARILGAIVPVCAGISLEYYFSYVDPAGWGCGTKLPHNITSLLGVMDGAGSDLRPGLPWQMVEIHEPVRLLFVIETTPEALHRIMDADDAVGKLIRNGWVQVATLSPDSATMHVFRGTDVAGISGGRGDFDPYRPKTVELPTAVASRDWYQGRRDHLGFALIGK